MRKVLSIWLALMLTVSLTVPVAAAESAVLTTDAFDTPVRYSATDTTDDGFGLGFCFTLEASGITQKSNYAVDLTNATLTYQGAACPITAMGAVVTHLSGLGQNAQRMVRAAAEDNSRVADIAAKKMYRTADDYAMYAVRVVGVPFELEQRVVYARPYVEILVGEQRVTLYGDTVCSSYADALAAAYILLPGYGVDVDGKGRMFVGDTSVLCDTLYIEFQDELDEWITVGDPKKKDTIYYECYDANGQKLACSTEGYGTIELPAMGTNYSSHVATVPLAEGTAEVRITGADILYYSDWEI